jgi:CBS domain-containing protein
MGKHARDVMTPNPVRCTVNTTLDDVAKLMAQHECGEIPVVDVADRVIGVVTDRDIACRVVAEGKNPMGYTVDTCMTTPVVTVGLDEPIEQVIATMKERQIRRVPVVDEEQVCVGIIAQADIALTAEPQDVATLVRDVSQESEE